MQKPQTLALAVLIFPGIALSSPCPNAQPNWNRVNSAHFSAYTAGATADALEVINQLEAVRGFVESDLKIHVPNFKIAVIMFDGRQDFSRYEPRPNTFAFFRRHGDDNYIIIKSTHGGPRRAIAHEYVHAVFANIAPELPIWLAEGLAEVYSETYRNGSTIVFGLPIAGHIVRLSAMPPGRVIAIFSATTSAAYADPSSVWDFYALSWAAVHALVAESKYSGKLTKFVLAANGRSTEDALRSVYGVSISEFASDVEQHIRHSSWQALGGEFAWNTTPEYSMDLVPNSLVAELLANISRTKNAAPSLMENRMREQAPRPSTSSFRP